MNTIIRKLTEYEISEEVDYYLVDERGSK